MCDIVLENVGYVYPNGHRAISDVNISIKDGENVAIIGQNGAGKTTTVKLMNNLQKPTEGRVLVGDKDTKDFTTAQISKIVGYVFQNPDDQIFHSTVEEEVRFGPKSMKLPVEEENRRVENALKMTGMDKYRDTNPFDLPLSMRKFITIAAVIAMESEVLIFDEPTAGQDIYGNQKLAEILKQLHDQGKTVITISHDMEFVVNNFSKVIVMANKHLVTQGTPKEIFWNFDALKEARLKQPYVSRICHSLGINEPVVTMEEAIEAISKVYGK